MAVQILTLEQMQGHIVCHELNAAYENLTVAINQLVKTEDIISVCAESDYRAVGVVARTCISYKVIFKFGGGKDNEKLFRKAQKRYLELQEKHVRGRKPRPGYEG